MSDNLPTVNEPETYCGYTREQVAHWRPDPKSSHWIDRLMLRGKQFFNLPEVPEQP